MRVRALPLVLAAAALVAAPAAAVFITYYPQSAGPAYLTVGRNGVLYYTDYSSGMLGFQSAFSGTHGATTTPNNDPLDVTTGFDGNIWFTDGLAKELVRYNPRSLLNNFTEFPLTNAPFGISAGPDGSIWFTEPNAGKIGRREADGTVTEFPVITTGSKPLHITLGPDGALWFTEQLASKIGRITSSGTVTEYPYPTAAAVASGIAAGPDGALWFCESSGHKIGRMTILGVVTEFPLGDTVAPFDIVAGPDNALWFTVGAYQIGRISTSGVVSLYDVDATAGSPTGIVLGPDGALWFGLQLIQRLGRISTAGDVNDGGLTNVGDVFYLINFLFAGGPPPL
jgi:virginiamycin B lyase